LNNLKQVNQGQQVRTFTYSSLSRLLTANNPESGLISYQYDNNGNLTTKTDARNITTTYNYDVLNRVTFRDYSDTTPDVTYTYDATNVPFSKGKLTKVSNAISETSYLGFDILGRVTSSQQKTDNVTYNPMTYTYNLSGALIEEKYPSGRIVKNTFDQDGDLQQVQSAKLNQGLKNYANAFTYTSAGAVSSLRLGNGKWENTTFNSRLQPIQIGFGSSATSQNLLKLNFDYGTTDNNGNVKSQTITTPNDVFMQTYQYDSLNRLTEAKEISNENQTWKHNFDYDRYGNRTTFNEYTGNNLTNNQTPQIDTANNRFTTATGFVYDLVGNVIFDNLGRSFNYDADNKQKSVINGSSTLGVYFFDGEGKRVKKVSTTENTIFVYDATGKMVAEYSVEVAIGQNAKTSYLIMDNLGSTRIITDEKGQVVSRRDMKPFGEEIARSNYGSDSVREKFATYKIDAETDLDFAQARMYSSRFGRFSTTDPIYLEMKRLADPQQISLYSYTRGNPLKFNDITGLDINVEFKNEKDKNLFLEQLNKYLKNYKVTINSVNGVNKLSIDGTTPNENDKNLSKGEKLLLEAITKKDSTGIIEIVNGDDSVNLGKFDKKGRNTIDVGDIGKLGKGGITFGEIVAHETTESYFTAKSKHKDDANSFEEGHGIVTRNGVGGLVAVNSGYLRDDKNPSKITGVYVRNLWYKEGEIQNKNLLHIFKFTTPIPESEINKQKTPPFTSLEVEKPKK
jgi:RHS repeat-associated protein